jgi:hypothetical protein
MFWMFNYRPSLYLSSPLVKFQRSRQNNIACISDEAGRRAFSGHADFVAIFSEKEVRQHEETQSS